MEPFTAAAAISKSLSTAQLGRWNLLLTKAEVQSLAPIRLMNGSHFQINALVENVPLGERHASFFSASEFREMAVIERPDVLGVQIRLGNKEIDLSLLKGDALAALGVKNAISYALTPAIDQFTRIRLQELGRCDAPVSSRLEKANPKLPTNIAVAVKPSEASAFLTQLEDVSSAMQDLEKPHWFSARRIDYLVGNQYIPGSICNLPLVGGISNMVFKRRLDLGVEGKDWAKLGEDVFMVISIAAMPLASVAGGLTMVNWIGANATFGAVSQGVISYLTDQNRHSALKNAGKGAILGAVGGVAGVVAAGKILPAISKEILASVASGATVGSLTGATSATIRVIEAGEDFATAAKEIALSTMVGGIGESVTGASLYAVSKIVSKLSPERLPALDLSIAKQAKEFERFQKQIEPMFPTDRPVHMGDIRSYSHQLDARWDEFVAHLKTTDASFGKHVDRIRTQMVEALIANEPTMIAKLERQMKQGLSGELAEARVRAIFRPFFEKITTQRRVQDGATIIDMVLEGAKHSIAIKSHRFVEMGGTMPLEVKAGSERYFKAEIESGHLLKQLGGHSEFGKGLVVTTRDVSDAFLSTGRAREILKEVGSTTYRLLPYKSEIDNAVKRLCGLPGQNPTRVTYGWSGT